MGKAFFVARREYLENVRTKGFWIGILSFPLILTLMVLVPLLFEKARDVKKYAVIDHSGWLLEAVERREAGGPDGKDGRFERVEAVDLGDDPQAALGKRVADGKLFAYFVIGENPVAGSEGCRYVSKNLTDQDLRQWFQSLASALVRERRLEEKRIDEATARWIQEPLRFDEKKVAGTGAEEKVKTGDTMRQWAPAVFVYLLWISVFMSAQMLLTNTIEEKSNRTIEVLLSSVSAMQLMAGKIAGIAATGLTVVGSWVFFFVLAAVGLPRLIGGMPDLDLAAIAGDPGFLVAFLVYFLLGYLLYAAILAAIGSVCNTLKESQNLMTPIVILLVLPLVAMMPIGKDPNGTLARTLSFIPPFTPFVMMNRAAGPPSVLEYALTTGLLLLSIAAAYWAAAKVFRIGILLTGKPPSPREILRWLRSPASR